MNVLLLTRYDRLAPSSRLRFFQYLPYLREHGVHVRSCPLLGDWYVRDLFESRPPARTRVILAYLRRLALVRAPGRFDLLWIEKELFPWLGTLGERLLHAAGIPYVVDFDDATFHTYDAHPRRVVRVLLGRTIDRIMRYASLVVAGNDYLADRARRAGARVVTLPTTVDLSRYTVPPDGQDDRFTIGWIGTPTAAHFLLPLREPFELLLRDPRVRITLVGAQPHALQSVSDFRPWSEETEVAEVQRFDVGVMPLSDGPWERGKCGYKLLQYMACGRPIVASPVGVNLRVVQEGFNGFFATNSAEWVAHLERLKTDPDERRRFGVNGRRSIEDEFSLDVVAPKLLAALRAALSPA